MKKKFYFFIFFIFLFSCHITAQNLSNRGKEFWLGYSFSANFFAHPGLSDPVNAQEMVLYISTSTQAANVTVSINGTSWSQTIAIPANTADASILIPKVGANDARILSDGLSTKGIHVVSDVPVAAYAHEYDAMFSAATMLMPIETWGYIYYSVNYYQTQSFSNPPFTQSNISANFPDWYNWFYIVAKEDNTTVTIIPSDTCKNGWLPGQPYTVSLNKGEIYTVFGKANFAAGWFTDTVNSSKDLTGSKVYSIAGSDGVCHPFAFFSGTGGMHVCQKDGGEAVQQQVFPLQAWGTRYLTHHTVSNFSGDINETFRNYYRVSVADPATVVKRNGVVLNGLIKNFYYQFMDSTGGDYIEANLPILVSQYMPNRAQCWQTFSVPQLGIGDPEMFYLSPIEQGQKSEIFYTSSHNLISKSYVNIIVPTTGINSLLLDGTPINPAKIKTHPNNPAYSVAIADISSGMDMQHTLTSDSAFIATVYGLGAYESYGYNVGCNINNLNMYGGVQNVFNSTGTIDTFTCLNTAVRLFVKIGYPATSITWHLSQVPGLSPNTDSIQNNPTPIYTELLNGRTYYVYTLQQDFTFSISNIVSIPISYAALVIPNCFNTEYAKMNIKVSQGPMVDFTSTAPACLADSIFFTGISNPNGFVINQYKWDFADGTTASSINTTKKFTTAGTQNVRFRTIATNGCMGDTTKQITIYFTPIAKFSASTNICNSDSVLISDSSSIAMDSITNWQYFFGDGTTATKIASTNFYHQYNLPGTYTIKLIATSNKACKSDTAYQTVTIKPSPLAKFGINKNICLGDSIKFTDSSTIAAGNIVSWQYNFGDGTTITKNNNNSLYYKYLTTGNYTVTLTVTSNLNCISTFSKTISVAAKPVATFTVAGKPCIDSVFTFTSSYPFTANATWRWNFGDAQTLNSTTNNIVTHAYTTLLNNIKVSHVVDIGGGCVSDTAFATIPIINKNPIANFTIKKDTVCENKPVLFTSALVGQYVWSWNFGNGIGNQIPPFTINYNTKGTYNISLIVHDNNGCGSAAATDNLVVNATPIVNAGADKFIQLSTSITMDATVSPTNFYNYLWLPSAGLNSNTILQPIASPATTTVYQLQVTDPSSNCIGIDSVVINVITKLYIPNVFTPNGDGKNDVWAIPGMALYPNGIVIIFNRYGQKIYETSNYTLHPWDGTYQGKPQNSGSYIYLIKLNDTQNQLLKGNLLIVR